ncbi:unnamed protein product [Tilletia caries]|nr:unnamed protein product [Tilletia caries]
MPQLLQLLQLAARNGAQQSTQHTPAQPPRSDGKFEAIFAALGGESDASNPFHRSLTNSTPNFAPYLPPTQSPRTPIRSDHFPQGPIRASPYYSVPAGAAPPSTPPPRNQLDFSQQTSVSPCLSSGLNDPAFVRASLPTPSSICLFDPSNNPVASLDEGVQHVRTVAASDSNAHSLVLTLNSSALDTSPPASIDDVEKAEEIKEMDQFTDK